MQTGQWMVRQEPILKPDGTPALDDKGAVKTTSIKFWVPAQKVQSKSTDYTDPSGNPVEVVTYADAEPENRLLYLEANFADLNEMVVW